MVPVFVLKNDSLSRFYFLRPFNKVRTYPLNNIERIEVKQKRQGYQSFPTMRIFFTENGKRKKHLFYFIKDSQKDFDNFIQEVKDKNINIRLLLGN